MAQCFGVCETCDQRIIVAAPEEGAAPVLVAGEPAGVRLPCPDIARCPKRAEAILGAALGPNR